MCSCLRGWLAGWVEYEKNRGKGKKKKGGKSQKETSKEDTRAKRQKTGAS